MDQDLSTAIYVSQLIGQRIMCLYITLLLYIHLSMHALNMYTLSNDYYALIIVITCHIIEDGDKLDETTTT